jgi:hypothetical protein
MRMRKTKPIGPCGPERVLSGWLKQVETQTLKAQSHASADIYPMESCPLDFPAVSKSNLITIHRTRQKRNLSRKSAVESIKLEKPRFFTVYRRRLVISISWLSCPVVTHHGGANARRILGKPT